MYQSTLILCSIFDDYLFNAYLFYMLPGVRVLTGKNELFQESISQNSFLKMTNFLWSNTIRIYLFQDKTMVSVCHSPPEN